MDNLEQFINDNRAAFDDEVPSLKVWAQIDQQLPQQRQRKIIGMRRVLQMAAAVVLLLGMGAVIGRYVGAGEVKPLESLVQQLPEELEEIEHFYQTQIDQKYQQLVSYKHDQSIEQDLDQLDETMAELKQELLDAPKGKEGQIIKSLIESYQTKISILELVLYRIQSNNEDQSKPKENEVSI